jgi:hypothetical protein
MTTATLDPRVHDMTVAQTAKFSLTGQVSPIIRVTYYIGTHGPFTDDYQQSGYTAEMAKAGIQRHIDALESLGALPPAGEAS